jgi:hypothetical protein
MTERPDIGDAVGEDVDVDGAGGASALHEQVAEAHLVLGVLDVDGLDAEVGEEAVDGFLEGIGEGGDKGGGQVGPQGIRKGVLPSPGVARDEEHGGLLHD